LIRLLELRPDLAHRHGSIAALAARAQARQSLKAASDELDFLRLSVSTRYWYCRPTPVGARCQAAHADRRTGTEAEVLDALDDLKQRAWSGVTSSCDWLPTPWPACPGMSDR